MPQAGGGRSADLIDALVQAGADPTAVNRDGLTPAALARDCNHEETAALLDKLASEYTREKQSAKDKETHRDETHSSVTEVTQLTATLDLASDTIIDCKESEKYGESFESVAVDSTYIAVGKEEGLKDISADYLNAETNLASDTICIENENSHKNEAVVQVVELPETETSDYEELRLRVLKPCMCCGKLTHRRERDARCVK